MESIEHALEGYAAAVRAKDIDGFVALYADDARVFDMWERWSYDGADALRGMAEEWFGSLGDEQAAVEFDGVQTVVGDEVAAAHAFVTYKRLSAEGTELRAMTNRLTWALHKSADDGWKIVHEHTSAPTDFETGKVQLKKPGSG